MTYIEFFDKNAILNVCSCLSRVPNRVVFVGNDTKKMKERAAFYQKMLGERGPQVEFLFRSAARNKLELALAQLERLLEEFEDCVFDITGGDELLLLALGVLREKHPEKNIQFHRINLQKNIIYDLDMDGKTIYQEAPRLSVDEHICIYGGGIQYGDVEEESTYRWVLDEDFLWDVELMWGICKKNVRMWNIQTGIFAAAERVGTVSQDGLTTTASIERIREELEDTKIYYNHVESIVSELLREKLLTALVEENDTRLCISYKNKQVKRSLIKAGQALELKIFTAAQKAVDKDGGPVYTDALNGVVLDWDGDLRTRGDGSRFDTENEVDVLLMHGTVPVFISCKNGLVTTEELYKLNTVANRFGGEYAQKALVATALDLQGISAVHLRQRAKDMGITLMEDVQDMEEEALLEALGELWNK